MKPITNKAEVTIGFADKYYSGSFARHSGFDAQADDQGVTLEALAFGRRSIRHRNVVADAANVAPPRG